MVSDKQMARLLYALADTMLEGVAVTTRIPPELIQTFVEGTAVGTAQMVKKKAKGRRAISAYNRAFGKAYKRQKAKMTKRSGEWKKNCNSAKCMKAAHAETRREMKR